MPLIFHEIAKWLEPLYLNTSYTHLSILNQRFIQAICDYLNITTRISHSWDYKQVDGKTERLAELCVQAGATEYVSGPSAKNYVDEQIFEAMNIKLTWFDYAGYPDYPQLWGEFTHGVTILDLLFNCGKRLSSPNEVCSSMKLSIVATLYQSASYIEEFHSRVSAAAKECAGDDYEIVLVNDGSPDNSLDIAISLTEQDSHVVLVDLSRNFGHHKAMMTGLSQSKGDQVFLIDSDLEEDPECLLSFFRTAPKKWLATLSMACRSNVKAAGLNAGAAVGSIVSSKP
nr:hypothetical protein GCM10020185_08470 [Pseudomonas brassicacearum subsp. brassicacearum]